ncbi:hypothetical protein [Neptuniibacter sp.]|uniref:hypothetical protein n=1 Tax=Neptuniibacter sp. TaxID=1962643 RepID=UPI002625CCCA|nr:hypothetical protein [Neptuniibacter sp.]MCP4597182.1 hypothetical protein [Neptuniibacter sp.]
MLHDIISMGWNFSVKFYEFTVSITLVSILVTLIISALARIERSLPPPHKCLLMASAINAKLCCAPEQNPSADASRMEAGTNYAGDWKQIFAAANNLASALLILIYLLGVLILFC